MYASESGEWKLGGFDVLSSMNDEEAVIYVRLLLRGLITVRLH